MEGVCQKHYSNLLADHYSWMFGLFDLKVEEQVQVFQRLKVFESSSAEAGDVDKSGRPLAVDLGCGSGFQSVALAQHGYEVIAVDTDSKLLSELMSVRAGECSQHIQPRLADLCNLRELTAPHSVDLVVCMGDTLTHLSSLEAVRRLFVDVSAVMKVGASFVISFRDLSTELTGVDRFIPVRSSADKILTCFLEYKEHHVMVHDLLQVRVELENGEISWDLKKSCYPKLRLSIETVLQLLRAAGFEPVHSEVLHRLWIIRAVNVGCM